jgi:hypothetical protein
MNLNLDTPEDIIKYLDFSRNKGQLEAVVTTLVPHVAVPKQDIEAYIYFCSSASYPAEYIAEEEEFVRDPVQEVAKKKGSSNASPLLAVKTKKRNQEKDKYPNLNNRWEKKELVRLKNLINAGEDLGVIANRLQRSPKSVTTKAWHEFSITFATTTNEWKYKPR